VIFTGMLRPLRVGADLGHRDTTIKLKSEMNKAWARPMLQLIALIAAFASCAGQAAMADQTKVFKWRDAKGVVSYSQNSPPQGTTGVTSLEVDTKTFTPAQRAAVRSHLGQIDAVQRADSARFRAQVTAADQTVNHALRSLSQAERAARHGRAPHAGDRVGNAGGGSRLRSEYFDRQKQLEDAIGEARVRVDEAYRLRSQVIP
jgi:hypothetical protein